jgi:hypothetical protein
MTVKFQFIGQYSFVCVREEFYRLEVFNGVRVSLNLHLM